MFQTAQGPKTEWMNGQTEWGSLTVQFGHSDHSVLAPVQIGTSHIYI